MHGTSATGVWATGATTTLTYAQAAGLSTVTYTVSLTVTDTVGLNAQLATTTTIQGTLPLLGAKVTGVVASGSRADSRGS